MAGKARSDANARTATRRGSVAAWTALAAATLLTAALSLQARRDTIEQGRTRFDLLSRQLLMQVQTRLSSYELLLRGAVGLFEASTRVERAEFHAYVQKLQLEQSSPGIQGIGYALRIKAGEVSALEAQVRGEEHPTFAVHPRDPREEMTSIIYLEPMSPRNLRAFGYDMYSEPVRRAAMERARDSGQPSVSGKVTLLQENGRDVQSGFLMYLPQYRRGHPILSLQQRQTALQGYVYAPFRMNDLMRTFGTLPGGIETTIYDGDVARADRLMYRDDHRMAAPYKAGRYRHSQAISLYGRTWLMDLRSTALFDATLDFGKAWVTLGGGLLASALLFAVLWQLSTTRQRAVALAERLSGAARSTAEELRHTVEALEAARDVAVAASRAKSEFLATMSHEVRTPLNGIIGMTDLLAETHLSGTQREMVRTTAQCGKSLLAIVNDILDFSKIEAGKLELESVPFDLKQHLADALTVVRELAAAKDLTLTVNVADDVAASVMGDPVRLQQVLVNLLSNAIKFTEKGGVDVRVSQSGPEQMRFEVCDTGIGVPFEARERLFLAFSQADGSTTRRYGGTGLGLAICKRLVNLMGGDIGVDSEPGRGSTFWFTVRLPGATVSAAALPPLRSATPVRETLAASAPRVLVVEDNVINQKVAMAMLARLHVQGDTASSGRAAIEAVTRGRYDLILMDCQMPEMDGYDTTAAIRNLGGLRVPIVALTANASAEDRQRCLSAGMDDYLTKPLRLPDLKRIVEQFIDA